LEKENNTIQPTARKVVRLIDQGIELTRGDRAWFIFLGAGMATALFSALEIALLARLVKVR